MYKLYGDDSLNLNYEDVFYISKIMMDILIKKVKITIEIILISGMYANFVKIRI